MSRSITLYQWELKKVPTPLAQKIDDVIAKINANNDYTYRRITQLWGRMYLASVQELTFFRVANGARPARLVTVGIRQDDPDFYLFLNTIESTSQCCDYLGITNADKRIKFYRFALPIIP